MSVTPKMEVPSGAVANFFLASFWETLFHFWRFWNCFAVRSAGVTCLSLSWRKSSSATAGCGFGFEGKLVPMLVGAGALEEF